jgi:hypothetical protein
MRILAAVVLSFLLLFNGAFAKGRSTSTRSTQSRTRSSRPKTGRSGVTAPKTGTAANSARKSSTHQHVSGYTRKDGEHVGPYMRSAPNGTQKDNFSTKGNVNPYTGKKGTKTPKK